MFLSSFSFSRCCSLLLGKSRGKGWGMAQGGRWRDGRRGRRKEGAGIEINLNLFRAGNTEIKDIALR